MSNSTTDFIMHASTNYEKELKQQKLTLYELKKEYEQKIENLEAKELELRKQVIIDKHKEAEMTQQIFLLNEIKQIYKEKYELSEKRLNKLEKLFVNQFHNEKETLQEKLLADQIMEEEHKTKILLSKKYYVLIGIMAVVAGSAFVTYSYYENQVFLQTSSNILTNYKTSYLVQNLKGDVINTWVSWAIAPDRVLHVNIVNTAGVSEDKINAVKDAIISKNTERIDDSLLHKGPQGSVSTYYDGWEGALTKASATKTQLIIPVKFNVEASNSNTGDVMIVLSPDTNPDGYTGFTKSISDEHNILRSTTTIYQAGDLSIDQIKAITRHEFGHVLGLAHSTAPEDLMHATIDTPYPYISDCDISAIMALYDGKESSQVVCTK